MWQAIKDLLLTPDTVMGEYQRRLNCTNTDYEALITQKNNEINRYDKERARLIDLFQSGLIERNEIEIRLKGVRSKIEQLNSEVSYLLNQDNESKKLVTVIHNLGDFALNINKNLDLHSFEEKRKIIKFLVEEIEVDTINEEIKVKHIIPLNPKMCQLRSGTRQCVIL